MPRPVGARVISVIVAFGVTPAIAQPLGDILDCAGPFAKGASEGSLKQHFGAENVGPGDIDIGEATTEPGTIVFPDDPKRRIEVLWHDASNRRQPRSIALTGSSTWVISARFPDRRRFGLGADLAQVEAINGRAFRLNGFGWVNGGYVVDWNGGALGSSHACRLDLRYSLGTETKPRVAKRVSGGRRFGSSDPAMRSAKPIVSEISLYWQSEP
ncbi:hypothetical protein [Bosea beijingensis]|uniref:hypothetical protein n=1 Tax=Bosea beijingensis TaxID=3068632 RepID=UPI0027404F74|nr:hypothetical protein [Bosea sp. REN20]